ncbi:MAG: WS/DGAT domain-containing protein [Deltaproteobacteria bacterium]
MTLAVASADGNQRPRLPGARTLGASVERDGDAPEREPQLVAGAGTAVVDGGVRRRQRHEEAQALARAGEYLRTAAGSPGPALTELRDAIVGLASAARDVIVSAPRTSLNPRHTGPRRRYAWATLDLRTVKAIGRAACVTVNDVVLTVVAGALERFFAHRGEGTPSRSVRVAIPVSSHAATNTVLGNDVSIMFASLPMDASDPPRQLRLVADAMAAAKTSRQAFGIAEGERLADWTTPSLLARIVRIAIGMRPYNLIVTNVPGPQIPLYFLDARMLEAFPLVPLYGNQAVGIAVLSYNGTLCVGINADADRVPDVDVLARAHEEAFEALRATCALSP